MNNYKKIIKYINHFKRFEKISIVKYETEHLNNEKNVEANSNNSNGNEQKKEKKTSKLVMAALLISARFEL